MGRIRSAGDRYYRELLPFAALVTMEATNVSLNTLFKLATRHGMSRHVFLVYAYGVAAFLLLPSPFFSLRSRVLPAMSLRLLFKIFVLGVVGYASQIMGYTGINFASPTLASAMSNLAPAFTFLLAVIFRMEKLELSSTSTRAKLIGTAVSIAGAFIITFYKGPTLRLSPSSSSVPLLHQTSQSNWIIGSLFLTVEYFLVPVWYIIQAHIMKEYPAGLTLVFFYSVFVSILAAIVGSFTEPDPTKWIITPSIPLASILCSGIFGCGLNNAIHTWALHLRGPVYVAMFKPLSIAIAAAMGVIILGDTLYLGCIIGATVIAIGFYTVMWGKSKEELSEIVTENSDLESSSSSSSQKVPLLQSHKG